MDKSFAILVVDDFKTMSRILCRMAQEIGFSDVDQVHDGYSALDRLRQKRYGLVISDWNMQPMTGAQLVQAMKAEPALAGIPTILITGEGCRHDEAWLTGSDAFPQRKEARRHVWVTANWLCRFLWRSQVL
jgi:CheY-like chemotaxis protein